MTAISWKSGISGTWTTASDWSTGTVPGVGATVTISAAPATAGTSYTVSLATAVSVSSVTLDQAAATFEVIGGTLTVATTFDLAAGTLALDDGSLLGGTYSSTAGTILVNTGSIGTISGVTWDGSMNFGTLTSGGGGIVLGQTTFAGTGGTGSGKLSIGSGVSVTYTGATLNNVAVTLGSGSDLSNDSGTLTIGSNTTISATGTGSVIGANSSSPETLVNQGSISTVGSSYLAFESNSFTNAGTITVASAGDLSIYPDSSGTNTGLINVAAGGVASIAYDSQSGIGTFTNSGTVSSTGLLQVFSSFNNSGLMSFSGSSSGFATTGSGTLSNSGIFSVANGASIAVGNGQAFTNTGTILVSDATLLVAGSMTVASLGKLNITNGGTLGIAGTLSNSGTLSVGSGTAIPTLAVEAGGTITGGTVTDPGSGLLAQGGTLSGVKYDGTLDLTTAFGSLVIAKGLTTAGLAGTGAGSIAITGTADNLRFTGSQTLNNASVTIGSAVSSSGSNYNDIITAGVIGEAAPTILTLGPSLTVTQVGDDAFFADANAVDSFLNQGTINAGFAYGNFAAYNLTNAKTVVVSNNDSFQAFNNSNSGTFTDSGSYLALAGTFSNTGLLSFSGADAIVANVSSSFSGYNTYTLTNSGTLNVSNGADIEFNGAANLFTNTGLVTIGAGSNLTLDTSAFTWSNAGTIDASGGSLTLGGTFTTARIGKVATSNGGSVLLATDAYLTNTGATLTIGTGTALGTISLAGTIYGGVIADAGNGIDSQETYDYNTGAYDYGTLDDVTYRGILAVSQNQTEDIVGGILLTGASGSGTGSILLNQVNSTLDFLSNQTLNSTAVSIGAAYGSATLETNATLTLSATEKVQQTGSSATIDAIGTIDNAGVIMAAFADGSLTLEGAIVNTGTIAVSNSETLVIDTSELTNTGVISVTNGLLSIEDGTAADLTSVKLINSAVAFTGVFTATGTTLSVGTGSSLPTVELEGQIFGGTIHDAGNGIQTVGFGSLDNVTYDGTLQISRNLATLAVFGDTTLSSLAGTQPGSLSLNGAGSVLAWDGTNPLDNATITIGSSGLSYEGRTVSAPSIVQLEDYYYGNSNYIYEPVVLGAHLKIVQGNTYAALGGQYDYYGGSNLTENYFDTTQGSVISSASITAAIAHGTFTFSGLNFVDNGSIAISNADTFNEGAANFDSSGLITIGSLSTLAIDLYNYNVDGSISPEVFKNFSTITLSGGTLTELTDGGTFAAVPILNAVGATISGFGSINAEIVNDGTITATSGTLALAQATSGTGTLLVDAAARLSLQGVSAGETAMFSGIGGVLGLSPASFLGEIGGFASGDTIDLAGTTANAASFSGNLLVVTLSAGGTISLTTASALSGSLTVTAGTSGDSLIHFASSVKHYPPSLPPLAPPVGIHDSDSISASGIFDDDRGFAGSPMTEWIHMAH